MTPTWEGGIINMRPWTGLTQATTYNNADLGCMAQVGNSNYHQDYSYRDFDGNLGSKSGVGAYNNNDSHHKHAVTSTGNGWIFTYDANGNMTTRVAGAITYAQGWDAENHLVSVSGAGLSASFSYDGDGVRVKGTVNGAVTAYVGNWFEWGENAGTPVSMKSALEIRCQPPRNLPALSGVYSVQVSLFHSCTGAADEIPPSFRHFTRRAAAGSFPWRGSRRWYHHPRAAAVLRAGQERALPVSLPTTALAAPHRPA